MAKQWKEPTPAERAGYWAALYNRLMDVHAAGGESFNQEYWACVKGKEECCNEELSARERALLKKLPICKTAACVAGHATQVVPELAMDKDGVMNLRTGTSGSDAFADAFGLNEYVAEDLCSWDAPHQTALEAAKEVLRLGQAWCEDNGFEIVDKK